MRERELRDLIARTSNVTINSHLHGRVRRAERGIDKRELQAAVKNGVKEAANPGRLGDRRWRYTYQGVTYITDETSRHEITSWRIGDASISVALAEGGSGGAHVVIVVDHSGSMRKPDVAGYATRTAAVYDCLARDFVQNQLAAGVDDVMVTLIEMSDGASVAFHKAPLDQALANSLQARSTQRARSHGNYLPALDKALEVMQADAFSCRTLMLLFLSDGEPSDHLERCCEHGVAVWKEGEGQQMLRRSGRSNLNTCFAHGLPWVCRKMVKVEVHKECLLRVLKIGDLLGRDRVVVGTVAFGGSDQDYAVLQKMGEALPRGSFHKLGLNAGGLRTAFSSLSSSLSVLHTDAGAAERTLRQKTVVKDKGSRSASGGGEEAPLLMSEGWLMYEGRSARKYRYSLGERKLVSVACAGQATGLAFYKHPFALGVERFCYRCAEISVPASLRARFEGGADPAALREARRLVSKEAKHSENLGPVFQTAMAWLQAEAAETARVFNRRVENVLGGVACAPLHLEFLEADVWWCYDESYPHKEAWVLVEAELQGRFRKWNNNNGVVYSFSPGAAAVQAGGGATTASALGAICEDEDDEEDDEEEEEPYGAMGEVTLDELPQVFSHFSHTYSSGKTLVCDLQGVWNAVDGFVFTDPVIHYVSSRRGSTRHHNGGTDKGANGVLSFFKTHRCEALCWRLGLAPPEMDVLLEEANTEVRACVICMNRPRGTRFAPCRHASCCEECADELVRSGDTRCPICRCAFTSVIERGAQVAAQFTHA